MNLDQKLQRENTLSYMTPISVPRHKPWMLDLVNPKLTEDQVLNDIPTILSKIYRYNNNGRRSLSVLCHSCCVAVLAYSKTENAVLALAALLHDFPEFALGDKTAPNKAADIALLEEMFGKGSEESETYKKLAKALEKEHDRKFLNAVCEAIRNPELTSYMDQVVPFDLAVLELEMNMLFPSHRGFFYPHIQKFLVGFEGLKPSAFKECFFGEDEPHSSTIQVEEFQALYRYLKERI